MDVESKETLDEAVDRLASKLQTVVETGISSFFGGLDLLCHKLDGTIVQSDPITINIPKLTIWLKMPKENS